MNERTDEKWVVTHYQGRDQLASKWLDYDPMKRQDTSTMSNALYSWAKTIEDNVKAEDKPISWIALYDYNARDGLRSYQAIADIVKAGVPWNDKRLRRLFVRLMWNVVYLWVALGLNRDTSQDAYVSWVKGVQCPD